MDVEAVTAEVDELARVLRADGGDLVLVGADPARARVDLRLVLDGVSCADCVLPPAELHETVRRALAGRLRDEFELVIDDPRVAGA
jgi:hypothetical protein